MFLTTTKIENNINIDINHMIDLQNDIFQSSIHRVLVLLRDVELALLVELALPVCARSCGVGCRGLAADPATPMRLPLLLFPPLRPGLR